MLSEGAELNENADAKTTRWKTTPVEIITERWGSDPDPTEQVIDVKMIDSNTARLDITIDLRRCSSIVIRPIRRDMDDVEGLIADAERLAND